MLKEYALFIGLILSVVISFYAGHWLTNNHWQAKYSALEADYAKAQVEANNAVRAQERLWQDKLQKVGEDAKLREQQLKNDSSELGVTVDGLREQLALSNSKLHSADSAITRLRAARATNRVVQAELCGWAIQRAEELANIADRNRQKGLACEAAHSSIRLQVTKG
jgi:hypothetical protein